MLKYIQLSIIERLVGRFNLSDQPNQSGLWTLSPTVVPVTNVDPLLKAAAVVLYDTPINVTATGNVLIKTVPVGKRWTLKSLYATVLTGTFTIGGFLVSDGANVVVIKFDASGSATYRYFPADGEVSVDQGWLIYAYIDTKAVNGTLGGGMLIEEEDAY